MTRFSRLSRAVAVSSFVLLVLTACTGSEAYEETETPTSSQSPPAEQTQEPIQGETLEIQHQLRMQIPDGWTALTENIPGLDLYILMVVPEHLGREGLEPESGLPDYAHLTVMDLGKTRNEAERYSAATMERDAENSSSYSDVTELEPRQIGDTTFYGYEGMLTKGGEATPFQYWHADANDVTFKVAIHADINGDIPAELEDAFNSLDFER